MDKKQRDSLAQRQIQSYGRYGDSERAQGPEAVEKLIRSRVEELAYFHIRTVEQLAAVNDAQLQQLGMGARELRERARLFLEVARTGTAPLSRLLARLETAEAEVGRLARDLKAANILIRTDTLDQEDRLCLIDLVGVRLRHPLPWRRRAQNLARLGLSLGGEAGRTCTDALRFLRLYLPWGLSPLNDWKGFWRAIEAEMRIKRSRNLRRGRPLS